MFRWGILCYLIGTTYSQHVQYSPYNAVLVPEESVQHTYVNPAAHVGDVPLHGQVPALQLATGNNYGIVAHIPSRQDMHVPAMSPAMGYHIPTHVSTPPISQPVQHIYANPVAHMGHVPLHSEGPALATDNYGIVTHIPSQNHVYVAAMSPAMGYHSPTYILQSAGGPHDSGASLPYKEVDYQSMELVPEDDLVKKIASESRRKKVKAEISKVKYHSDRSDSSKTDHRATNTRGHTRRVSSPYSPRTRHVTHYENQQKSSLKNGKVKKVKARKVKAMPKFKSQHKLHRPHVTAVDHDDRDEDVVETVDYHYGLSIV